MKKIEFLFFFYHKIEITWKTYFELVVTFFPSTQRKATADCTFELERVRMVGRKRGTGWRSDPACNKFHSTGREAFKVKIKQGSRKTEPKTEQQTCYRFYMLNIWDTKPAIGVIMITIRNNLICCCSRSGKEFNEPRKTFYHLRDFLWVAFDAMQVRIIKLCKIIRL